jgi:hypothetical protein
MVQAEPYGLVLKPEGKNVFEELGAYERIILKWILNYRMRGSGLNTADLGLDYVTGCCDHGGELSVV